MNQYPFVPPFNVAVRGVMVCLVIQSAVLRADEPIPSPFDSVAEVSAVSASEQSSKAASYREDATAWEFFVPVSLPEPANGQSTEPADELFDVILTTDVYQYARSDLADLRLFDAQGNSVPYRLRTLSRQSIEDPLRTTEFNRTEPVGGPQEVTLEVPVLENNQAQDVSHNEIRIETSGKDFRRAVTISGSDDGQKWKLMASGNLVRFKENGNSYQRNSISYSPSRFRLVRVVVEPDQSIEDEFRITRAVLMRRVELPGEMVTTPATVMPREPGRVNGAPGSIWVINLGGENIPCHELQVDVADSDFARDVQLEHEVPARFGPTMVFSPMYRASNTTWQRRQNEPHQPMTIEFPDVRTSRLRLKVTDHRNKPLTITAARTVAAARQLLFERPEPDRLPLKLYFGNPEADFPNYDFARNLPEKPNATVIRASLGSRDSNPAFTPPPKALTERLPWLIYVVLSFVSVVLAAVITSLSRSAIAMHDSQV